MEFLIALLCLVPLIAGEETINPSQSNVTFDVGEPQQTYPSTKEGQLYYDVSTGNCNRALIRAQELIARGEESEIKTVVEKLIRHQRIYLVPFAYKLYSAGLRKVVEKQFPTPFRMVFNDSVVLLTHNRYGSYPLQYSRYEDLAGDYSLFINEEKGRVDNYNWRFEPVDDGRFFKIFHIYKKVYMKLGTAMDSDGDYEAFGSPNSDTDRHLWILQPVTYNGRVTFCIINRAHYQALKVATKKHDGYYRTIYSTDGDFYNYPERYGWRIDVLSVAI